MLCPNEDHNQGQIIMVCARPDCKATRLLCMKCLLLDHKECGGHILEIENIMSKNFLKNFNMIPSVAIRDAIKLMYQKDVSDCLQAEKECERRVNQQFDVLLDKILEKASDKKSLLHKIVSEQLVNQDEAGSRQEFIRIVGLLKDNNTENVEAALDGFFQWAKASIEEGSDKAKLLYKLKSLETLDDYPFAQAKVEVARELNEFHSYLRSPFAWKWKVNPASKVVELREDGMVALNTGSRGYIYNKDCYVFGDIEFTEGKYRWTLDIENGCIFNSKNINGYGYYQRHIYFGIVKKETALTFKNDGMACLNHNLMTESVSLSLKGFVQQMVLHNDLGNYDSKTYVLDLDMEEGVFLIYCGGKLIAKTDSNIKGSTFIPFIYISNAWEMVRLRRGGDINLPECDFDPHYYKPVYKKYPLYVTDAIKRGYYWLKGFILPRRE